MKTTQEPSINLKQFSNVGCRWRFRVCDVGMKEEDKPEWGPEHPNLILVEGMKTEALIEECRWSGFLGTYPAAQNLHSGTGTTPNAVAPDGTFSQTGTTVTRATGTGTFVAGNVGDFIKFSTGETCKILSITSTVEVEVNKSQTVAATTIAIFDTSRTTLDNLHNSKSMSYGTAPTTTADAYDAASGTQTFRRNFQSDPVGAPITYTEFGLTTVWSGVNTILLRVVLDEGVNLEVDQFLEAQIALSVTTENFKVSTPLTVNITGWPYEYAIQSITSDGTNWDIVVSPDCNAHLLVGNTINIAGALPTKADITGITSTASDFTVTAPGHGLTGGESVEIEGASPAGYNGTWTVASVSGDDVTITDGSNLGAGSGGTIRQSTPGTWYDGAHTIASFPAANTIRITNATTIISAGADGTAKGSAAASGIIQGKCVSGVVSTSSPSREWRGVLDFGWYLAPTASSRHLNAQTGTPVAGLAHGGSVSGVNQTIDIDPADNPGTYDEDAMVETLSYSIPSNVLNLQNIVQFRLMGQSTDQNDGAFWITFDEPQRKDEGFVLTIVFKHYWEPELNDLEIG